MAAIRECCSKIIDYNRRNSNQALKIGAEMSSNREKITETMQQSDEDSVNLVKLPGCRSPRRRKRGFDESTQINLSRIIIKSTQIRTPLSSYQIGRPFRGPRMLLAIFLVSLHFGYSARGSEELSSTSKSQQAHESSTNPTTAATTSAPSTTALPTTDSPILTTGSEFNDLAINERGDETGWLGLTTTSESPGPLSTTSSFDKFALGNDEDGSFGNGNSSDIDYILANTIPTGAPEATTTLTDQVGIDNNHQSSGVDETSSSTFPSKADEQRASTSTEADNDERLNEPNSTSNLMFSKTSSSQTGSSTSPSVSERLFSTTTSSVGTEKLGIIEQIDKDSTSTMQLANATSETLNSQLIRNRKSSENGTKSNEYTINIQPDTFTSRPNSSEPKNQPSFGSFVEYDDFDLDYQLKLNTSSPISTPSLLSDIELSGQNLNKRDNNLPVKPPDWTALIRQQPHVFSPTNTSNYFHHQDQQALPMIPSLLTVESTQLTSQELNKIRPQFLFYQDQDSNPNTYLQEHNQAVATGDLIATASAAGAPSSSTLNNSGNLRNLDWIANKGSTSNGTAQSMITLINGSPVFRNNQYVRLFDGKHLANQSDARRLLDEMNNGVVTTIVVDNMIPTEAPSISHQNIQTTSLPQQSTNQTRNSTPSPTTAAPISTPSMTTTITTTGKPESSQTNQWYNYPYPNLHHNPLLLHHILNKPSVYAQHVDLNQSRESGGPPAAAVVSVKPIAPFSPTPLVGTLSALSGANSNFAQQPSNNQQQTTNSESVANRATNYINIIEKPTLGGDLMTTPPSPINRTQLQMQLNEMRAIAASNGFKQNGASPIQPGQLQAQNLIRSDINQALGQQKHQQILSSQHHRGFTINAPTKSLSWQKNSNEPTPSDFLSHLIGPKTLLNAAMPSNFHPTFETIRPPTMKAPNFHGEESSVTLQPNLLPVTSTSPPPPFTQRYPNMNVVHHFLGNNLNHPLAFSSRGHNAGLPGSLRQLNSFSEHVKAPMVPVNIRQIDQKQLINHLMTGGMPINQLNHQQPMFKTLHSGPKIMTSPSLLQEVYTARPTTISLTTSPATNNQTPTVTPCPTSTGRDSLMANQTVTRQNHELSGSASNVSQKQSTMSDEDMSTYVAQLASLSAQVNQTPGLPDSNSPSVEDTSIMPTSALDGSSTDVVNFFQKHQQKSHLNSSQENLELLTQKILDVIAQQASAEIQQSPSVQVQQQQQQFNNLNEILRSMKLVGLPGEVQAQIYRELGPILQTSNSPNKLLASPPYSALQLSALNSVLSGNKWPKPTILDQQQTRTEPSLWRQPMSQLNTIGSAMSDSQDNNYYYKIDSHQKQQKKDREEQLNQQVLNSERQRQKQRQKQIAFIEALRTSVMKMQNLTGIIDSDLEITSPSKTTNTSIEDLTSLANSIEPTNVTSNSVEPSSQQSLSSSVDDFDEQSKDPIPEWLERQIIQESLVHEISRVHPLGHTIKSTVIGTPLRPMGSHFTPPIIARPSAPATILRPAASHFYPTHMAKPVYPLHPLRPVPGQLHPLTASAHYHGGPVGRLTPVKPHTLLSEGSQPPSYHSTIPYMATASSSTPSLSPIMQPHSFQQLQLPMTPVNPTKLLSDRFPFASAPAYLVKLPTLAGGTITASGSLVPPSRLLASHLQNRPSGPLRFLNSAMMGQPRIKLMSNMMHSAPSIIHAIHQPPTAHNYHHQPSTLTYSSGYSQAPSAYTPIYGSQNQHHHPQPSYQNSLRSIYLGPLHQSFNGSPAYYNQGLPSVTDTLTSVAHTISPNQHPSELVATSSAAITSQMGTNLPASKLLQMNSTYSTPLIVPSNISSGQQNGLNQMMAGYGGVQQGTQQIIQQLSPANTFNDGHYRAPNQDIYVNHPLHHVPIFSPAGATRYQQTSPSLASSQQGGGQQTNGAASTLSRLQQATASLVELTSLASLVEEMVGGSDFEASPAVALANAINSLSAAQNSALNTQASTNGPSSSVTAGSGSSSIDQLQQQQPVQQIGGLNQVNGIFSLRNLLNPILWRDKSWVKPSSTLERFVAGRKVPTAKLKVKYIRVPVAVYETSGANNGNNNAFDSGNNNNNNNGFSNQNQLATKNQLAEIIASSANPLGGSSASVESLPSSTSVVAPPGGSTVPTSGQAASGLISSNANQLQANGNNNQNIPNTLSAASSADYLFDELSMDSVPKLALALTNSAKEDNRVEYLPIGLTALRQPLRQSNKLATFTGYAPTELNSLESALFYSLLNPSSAGSNNEPKVTKLIETSDKKKRGRKSKKSYDDDDDDESEDGDDDDLITANDLPILESLISTVIHGSPDHHHHRHPMSPNLFQNPPQQILTSSPGPVGWRARSPFGGFRGEASTNAETYAHPTTGLNPFSKHSHKFSLGEVVGAIGVRKLISSLLNKRKISRTNKREVLQNNQPLAHQSHAQNHSNNGKKKYGKLDTIKTNNDVSEFSRSTELPFTSSSTTTESVLSTLATPFKYPPTTAYDSRLFDTNRKKLTPTSSRPAKRKLNSLARPVISIGSSDKNFTLTHKVVNIRNNNNETDIVSAANLSENHSSKRLEASSNQVIDLNPKESTMDQTKSPVAIKSYSKVPAEEQVQFKFLLQPNLSEEKIRGDSIKNNKSPKSPSSNAIDGNLKEMDKIERRKENKIPMPLYYVVADHYNKLQQGRSQKNNGNGSQQPIKSTVTMHDNDISKNRLQLSHQ